MNKHFFITYSRWTPADLEEGEASESGWIDANEQEHPNPEGLYGDAYRAWCNSLVLRHEVNADDDIDFAAERGMAKCIIMNYAEPTSVPWTPGCSYTASNGNTYFGLSDRGTALYEETLHLEGFAPWEERLIYFLVKRRNCNYQLSPTELMLVMDDDSCEGA